MKSRDSLVLQNTSLLDSWHAFYGEKCSTRLREREHCKGSVKTGSIQFSILNLAILSNPLLVSSQHKSTMLLFAVFSIVSMTGSIWSHDSEITEFAGHSFPQRDLTKIIVKNGKLHGEQEVTLYGRIDPNDTCPTVGGIGQYPSHYYKDPKLSFCAPYCIDGSCPPAPAANKPTCDDPPGVCIILCDGDADCQEDAICINTGKAGVCAFNTTES